MATSPVPIYLGWAGLIVGSLGLGVQYFLDARTVSATDAPAERPLFARSVEEAPLAAEHWPSRERSVAYYRPMLELMTWSAAAQASEPSTQAQSGVVQDQRAAMAREATRETPRQQARSSKRARARAKDERAPITEPDAREARAQADVETTSRRSDRRSRERRDGEEIDSDYRADRRQREAESRRYDDRRYRERGRGVEIEDVPDAEPRYVAPPGARERFAPPPIFEIFGSP
jgi:hypothetical protein